MPWGRARPEIMGVPGPAVLRPTAATRAALRWHEGPRRRVRQAFGLGMMAGAATATALIAWVLLELAP
jgi:hypothetical protein